MRLFYSRDLAWELERLDFEESEQKTETARMPLSAREGDRDSAAKQ